MGAEVVRCVERGQMCGLGPSIERFPSSTPQGVSFIY